MDIQNFNFGALWTIGAVVCWGVGDYLIQGCARKVGYMSAYTWLCLIGSIIFFPVVFFVDLHKVFALSALIDLLVCALTGLVAGLLLFYAFEKGKLSVTEPILAFEVALVAVLERFVLHQSFSLLQIVLIGCLIIGVILLSTPHLLRSKNLLKEKGTYAALISLIFLATYNFYFAKLSLEVDPWFAAWSTCVAIFALLIVWANVRGQTLIDVRPSIQLVSMGVVDNLAWLFLALLVYSKPIAWAYAGTESYIAVACALGIWLRKEKLSTHQWVGLVMIFLVTTAILTH